MKARPEKAARAGVAFAAALALQACHHEGPAERAGEKIDNAIDSGAPSAGPAQKAGRALDKAASSMHDAARAGARGDPKDGD